jgi:hypothetical protein
VAITCHAKDGYVLLFSGEQASGPLLSDTWKFVGGKWTELKPSTAPPERYEAGMAFDTAAGYDLLFGGNGKAGPCWAIPGSSPRVN